VTMEDLKGANWSDEKTYRKNRNRLSNVRWKFGEDPYDPDTHPDSGWNYVSLDVTEHEAKDVNPYKGKGGTDSGVTCFTCRAETYRIVDERTPAQVLAELPDEQWRRSQGRGYERAAPRVYLLVCPKCEGRVQMNEEALERVRRAKGD
jgi:hypothetical protein